MTEPNASNAVNEANLIEIDGNNPNVTTRVNNTCVAQTKRPFSGPANQENTEFWHDPEPNYFRPRKGSSVTDKRSV